MELKVGDLVHWKDSLWDKLVIYRGPSFLANFHWFDFVCCQESDQYEQGGFHSLIPDPQVYLRVLGHIDGVEPVRWNPNPKCYGKKLIEK